MHTWLCLNYKQQIEVALKGKRKCAVCCVISQATAVRKEQALKLSLGEQSAKFTT